MTAVAAVFMRDGAPVAASQAAGLSEALEAIWGQTGRRWMQEAGLWERWRKRARGSGRTRSSLRGLGRLGVEVILAGSLQAKGRVERSFGTAQDRPVKEMRVTGVAGMLACASQGSP